MSVSKSFSAVGVSGGLRVRPGQSATVALAVAGGETFTGLLAIQSGTSPEGPWLPAQDANGADLETYDSINGPEAVTAYNHTPKTLYLRVSVSVFTGDDVTATMTAVDGERVSVLLRSPEGAPVAWLLDDGRVEMVGVVVPGLPLINPVDAEYITSPGAVGLDVFETRITTSGSQGNEAVTIGTDGLYPGQRKLITIVGLGDPADVVVFDHESLLGQAGEELDAVTCNAAFRAFLLLEYTGATVLGARWQIIRSGEFVTVTPAP